MVNNLVLIGASSEIAEKLILQNKSSDFNIFGITSKDIEGNFLKVNDYIDESQKIIEYIKEIKDPTIIFFNGYLKENRDKYFPNDLEIKDTLYINFLLPYLLTLDICKNIYFKKLVYISSIAAVKPRYKNYIYGISKKSLENSIKNLNKKNTLAIRFGKVQTKMSAEHKDPPFTISANQAADVVIQNLHKEGIIYSSFGIHFMAMVIKLLPIKFINYIEGRNS